MLQLHQSSRDADFPTELELPIRLLKQVLVGHGLKFGARVLVAGCGHGELVAFLDGIAYSVDAIDDCPEGIAAAQKKFSRFEFHYARLDEAIPAPQLEFDLILVQDLCVYRENLLDVKTRSATANLLACLKPAGELVFIRKVGGTLGCGTEHNSECWHRHLACFPGQLESRTYRESFFQRAGWDWLVGRREHHDFFTVTLQTPADKLSRDLWRDFAFRGMMTGKGLCCAPELSQSFNHQRAA